MLLSVITRGSEREKNFVMCLRENWELKYMREGKRFCYVFKRELGIEVYERDRNTQRERERFWYVFERELRIEVYERERERDFVTCLRENWELKYI